MAGDSRLALCFNGDVRSRHWWRAGVVAVLILAARLGYLTVTYQGPGGAVKRPHIESAALLLAIAGFSLRFASDNRTRSVPVSPARPPIVLWPLFACAAAALYWPALSLGPLSDDFILIQHARVWDVQQVAPQLFRPFPIFTWAVVLHLGGGVVALHALNILLHATNAYLAACVVTGWVQERSWAAAAGLLVLSAPLAPEAVAWCAGVFDLMAAAFVMVAVLIARRYGGAEAGPGTRLSFVLTAAVALLSKETAVVLPVVVLLDSAIRRQLPKTLRIDLVIVALFAAAFGAYRLHSQPGIVAPASITRYRVQRLLFDSFGSLAAPWHAEVVSAAPFVRAAIALLVIGLLTAFFVGRGSRWRSNAALGAAMWVLISLVPLLTMFYIGPQLEGSRYLYLATVGWAAALTNAASELSKRGSGMRLIGPCAIAAIIAASLVGVRAHLVPWEHAAAIRDTVLRAAAADVRLRSCPEASVQNLPESMEGAYLFANGAREALGTVGANAFVRDERGVCSFRWDPASSTFLPSSSAR